MFRNPNIIFLYFLGNQTEVEKKNYTFSGSFRCMLLMSCYANIARFSPPAASGEDRRLSKLVEFLISLRNICGLRVSSDVGLLPARPVDVSISLFMLFRLTATFGVHFIVKFLISAHFSESHCDFWGGNKRKSGWCSFFYLTYTLGFPHATLTRAATLLVPPLVWNLKFVVWKLKILHT